MKRRLGGAWSKGICMAMVCVLLCGAVPGMADTVMEDRPKSYSTAVTFANLGQYQEAMERFATLKTGKAYEDSAFWYDYCYAMVRVEAADEYQAQGYRSDAIAELREAKTLFGALKTREFQDSMDMYAYCDARIYYLQDYLQSAIDLFTQLYGVRDAWDYYTMLKNGETLPEQVPVKRSAPVLERVQAKSTKQIELYDGPGSEYARFSLIIINSNTDFYICGRCENKNGKWLLLEVETDNGPVRCWARDNGYVYSAEPKNAADIMNESKTMRIQKRTEAKFGPGEQYADCGVELVQWSNVTAYQEEAMYTMVDYTVPETGDAMCVWVLTDCLR